MRKIAVTTDFSEEARRSFAPAGALARKFGSTLFVVNVAPPPVVSPWPDMVTYSFHENLFGIIDDRLREAVESEESLKGLAVERRVLAGNTVEALQGFLEDEEIDLLVIASHGLAGVKRFILGSVADRLIRQALCPVLVYRALEAAGPESPVFPPRRILVPHDLSSAGRTAMLMGRDWARAFGSAAQLLLVIEATTMLYSFASETMGEVRGYEERVRAEGHRRLENIVQQDWRGVETSAVTVIGRPADEILRAAASFHADLIVMGTHGRSGLEHFFLGSVAEKTIRQARCPILVVRDHR
jgi:nucleotide-binding universal stress UspA family protein